MSGVGEGVLKEVVFVLTTDEYIDLHWVNGGIDNCGKVSSR